MKKQYNCNKKYYFSFLLLFIILFIYCSKDENEDLQREWKGNIELPALRNGANDIFLSPTTTFSGEKVITYSMEYDKSKKHARWIAFKYYNVTGQTNWNRNDWKQTEWGGDPWQSDPRVPQSDQRTQSDFGKQGYVRGHICASSDRLYSKDANEQTFYYTNMSPQTYNFNGAGTWYDLEGKVRTWGRSSTFRDTLYVVKGGTIDKESQIKEYISNDKTKPVPKYYFMALLCKKGETYKAIGFWMDQFAATKPALSECARTIDELEELTGLDFFHNLPDNLEEAVESKYAISAWTGLQ